MDAIGRLLSLSASFGRRPALKIAGIGITHVLSYQVAQAIREGKLRIVLTDYESEPMPAHLVDAGLGLLPLKMRSFLEYAAPRLRKSPASDQSKLDKGIAKARSLRSKAGLKVR